jgi:Lrp/AsnC family transcriptional regulator for asnA, asnC and gidA
MLDDISFKILLELCHDGRSSNAKLARKLGISVVTVAKRVNALIKEGVIEIKAIPNRVKMGYRAQAFIGLDVDLKKIDSVCAQLMNNSHISKALTSFGRFDVLLILCFREWEMLQNFIEEELQSIEGVTHIETYLVSEAKKRYRGIFANDLATSKPTLINETDEKIIRELMRNGRIDYADLGNKLGMSTSTVSRRVAFLIKESIIKIMAIPNPSKLGYLSSAYVALHADLAKVDKICDQLSSYPQVYQIMRLMNGFEILLGVHSPNTDMLFNFLKSRIANIDGVLNSETFIRGDFLYFSADAMFIPSIVDSLGKNQLPLEN